MANGKFRKWIGPSTFVEGAPSIRDHHGFAECKGKLYVFGGEGVTGLKTNHIIVYHVGRKRRARFQLRIVANIICKQVFASSHHLIFAQHLS
jgi:hypothetical protein